jgi:hypothetical protein
MTRVIMIVFGKGVIDNTSNMMYSFKSGGYNVNVYRYQTAGGKDLIAEYLDNLPIIESAEGWKILEKLEEEGFDYLKDILETRPIDIPKQVFTK